MTLFRFLLFRNRRQMPTWATKSTTEMDVVRHEAEALIAESRSRRWASVDTGQLRTIRERLQDLAE